MNQDGPSLIIEAHKKIKINNKIISSDYFHILVERIALV